MIESSLALVRYGYKPTASDYKIIEKALKALEIIKNNTHIIEDESGEHIVIGMFDIYTHKEEYDLLKEVLQ